MEEFAKKISVWGSALVLSLMAHTSAAVQVDVVRGSQDRSASSEVSFSPQEGAAATDYKVQVFFPSSAKLSGEAQESITVDLAAGRRDPEVSLDLTGAQYPYVILNKVFSDEGVDIYLEVGSLDEGEFLEGSLTETRSYLQDGELVIEFTDRGRSALVSSTYSAKVLDVSSGKVLHEDSWKGEGQAAVRRSLSLGQRGAGAELQIELVTERQSQYFSEEILSFSSSFAVTADSARPTGNSGDRGSDDYPEDYPEEDSEYYPDDQATGDPSVIPDFPVNDDYEDQPPRDEPNVQDRDDVRPGPQGNIEDNFGQNSIFIYRTGFDQIGNFIMDVRDMGLVYGARGTIYQLELLVHNRRAWLYNYYTERYPLIDGYSQLIVPTSAFGPFWRQAMVRIFVYRTSPELSFQINVPI